MFERFTDRARRVVVMAQEEARLLQHSYIGTEHMLLGLLSEGEGLAARVLRDLEINLEALAEEVKELIGRGASSPSGHIPFTPEAKKALELSLRESLQLGHDYIGTEHLLLGVLHQGDGAAPEVLVRHGADLNTVRGRVAELLAQHQGQPKVKRGPGATALSEISLQLAMIGQRLTAIEARLGIEEPAAHAELRGIVEEISEVRRAKESAIDQKDFARAASLRDTEKQLLARRQAAERAMLEDPPAAAP